MKKTLLIIIIIIFTITGCERDDICIDPITPDLIIRFFDAEDLETFKSVNLEYDILDIKFDSLTVSGDSLLFPLRIDDNLTRLTLAKRIDNDTIIDTLTISYNRQEEIVGRSCGFRTIFNNVSIDRTQNWIQDLQIETPLNITDETSAHVKIFH